MKQVGEGADVVVDGRRLSLTNLDKIFYPGTDFTKAHVLDYYRRIAPAVLPHLKDRPVTLKRYPHGSGPEYFYEKQCPSYRPDWFRTVPIWSQGRDDHIDFCVLDDLPSLMWVANLSNLELHAYLHKASDPTTPTAIVFDLDPGEGVTLVDCARVALNVRALFSELGLDAYPKSSGSAGLHVWVPLNTPTDYEQTKTFAKALAEALERDDPKRVTANMSKAKRVGKVFIDWSQNDDHKTTGCVYSLRATARPTCSTPLKWSEVEDAVRKGNADGLVLEAPDLLARVEREGDLFARVAVQKQTLPKLV